MNYDKIENKIYEEYRKKLGKEIIPVYKFMSDNSKDFKIDEITSNIALKIPKRDAFFKAQKKEVDKVMPIHRRRYWNYQFYRDAAEVITQDFSDKYYRSTPYGNKKLCKSKNHQLNLKSFFYKDGTPVLVGQLPLGNFRFTKKEMQETLLDAISIQAEEYTGKENNYFGNFSLVAREVSVFIEYLLTNFQCSSKGFEGDLPYTLEDVFEVVRGYVIFAKSTFKSSTGTDDSYCSAYMSTSYLKISRFDLLRKSIRHDYFKDDYNLCQGTKHFYGGSLIAFPTIKGLSKKFIKETNKKYKKLKVHNINFITNVKPELCEITLKTKDSGYFLSDLREFDFPEKISFFSFLINIAIYPLLKCDYAIKKLRKQDIYNTSLHNEKHMFDEIKHFKTFLDVPLNRLYFKKNEEKIAEDILRGKKNNTNIDTNIDVNTDTDTDTNINMNSVEFVEKNIISELIEKDDKYVKIKKSRYLA